MKIERILKNVAANDLGCGPCRLVTPEPPCYNPITGHHPGFEENTMRLYTFLLPLATCCLWTASAQTSIRVANPAFDDDEIFCDGCYYPAITGWAVGPNSGVQKSSTTIFPGGLPGGSTNFAYVGNANSTGSITQVLAETVRANHTYTLKMSLGQQLGIGFPSYVAALGAANGATLASDSSLNPARGTFLEETIVYNSGSNPPQAGLPLVIFVKSYGVGQVDIVNVSLTIQ
jgi:hypothetical protein